GFRRGFTTRPRGLPEFYSAVKGAPQCLAAPRTCDVTRGVSADDKMRLVSFHLSHPDPDFLYKLTRFVYPAPPGTPWTDITSPLPGTGPYMISGYAYRASPWGKDHSYSFTDLVPNPHFIPWSFAAQPRGYPARIHWMHVPTFLAAVRAVIAGRADVLLLSDEPNDQGTGEGVRTQYPGQLVTVPQPGTFFDNMNTRAKPFTDPNVRRAVNYAVDRDALIRVVHRDAVPTCQMLPPNFPSYQWHCPYTREPHDGRYHGRDLATARRLVAQSGTRGIVVTVTGSVSDHAENRYIASVLGELGYRARLHEIPVGQDEYAYVNDPRNHVQISTQIGSWNADYPSAGNFYYTLYACSAIQPNSANNESNAGFCDKNIDRLADTATALQASDPGKARRMWTKVDARLTDSAPFIATYNENNTYFVSSRVHNLQVSTWDGPLLDQMWIR
ncbi:MAG: hypothetical protein J2P17_23920, partial [Mycobacterium sp.]|nr:hypothetical protein [Mycobacterium sp.]